MTGSITSESYSFSEVSYECALPETRNIAAMEEARKDRMMSKEEDLCFRRSAPEVSLASNQYDQSPLELAKSREETEHSEASSLSMTPTVSYQAAAAPLSESVIIDSDRQATQKLFSFEPRMKKRKKKRAFRMFSMIFTFFLHDKIR